MKARVTPTCEAGPVSSDDDVCRHLCLCNPKGQSKIDLPRVRRRLRLATSVGLVVILLGCAQTPALTSGTAEPSPDPTPSRSSVTPSVRAPVTVPSEPLPGEVARYWYVRPGNNKVAVGPYAVDGKRLVVRGACLSESRSMTWKIFDSSDEAESRKDVEFVDQGRMPCDGEEHTAEASVGKHRDLAVLAVTGTKPDEDTGESVWVIVANE